MKVKLALCFILIGLATFLQAASVITLENGRDIGTCYKRSSGKYEFPDKIQTSVLGYVGIADNGNLYLAKICNTNKPIIISIYKKLAVKKLTINKGKILRDALPNITSEEENTIGIPCKSTIQVSSYDEAIKYLRKNSEFGVIVPPKGMILCQKITNGKCSDKNWPAVIKLKGITICRIKSAIAYPWVTLINTPGYYLSVPAWPGVITNFNAVKDSVKFDGKIKDFIDYQPRYRGYLNLAFDGEINKSYIGKIRLDQQLLKVGQTYSVYYNIPISNGYIIGNDTGQIIKLKNKLIVKLVKKPPEINSNLYIGGHKKKITSKIKTKTGQYIILE